MLTGPCLSAVEVRRRKDAQLRAALGKCDAFLYSHRQSSISIGDYSLSLLVAKATLEIAGYGQPVSKSNYLSHVSISSL